MTRRLAQILNYRVLDLIELAEIEKKDLVRNAYFKLKEAIQEVIDINQTQALG